jgi:hypothetical protein
VSSLAQLLLDFPKFRTAAVAPGLPFKLENSPAGFAAEGLSLCIRRVQLVVAGKVVCR